MTKNNRQNKDTVAASVNLIKNLQEHIEPIEYDRWAKLASRNDLTEKEKKEDKEIMETIKKIKSHKGVKVVESE